MERSEESERKTEILQFSSGNGKLLYIKELSVPSRSRVWERLNSLPFPTANRGHTGFPYCLLEVRMNFFLNITPPTATAQMRKVRLVRGIPFFYDPAQVKQAKAILMAALSRFKPEAPLTGPLGLKVQWLFPAGRSHKHGEWRVTRPDTDNLQKLLKDCMTAGGFWADDAQVVRETVEKQWSNDPVGIAIRIEQLEAANGS